MSYPGFCAKYGPGKMLSAAYLGPVLADVFIRVASGIGPSLNSSLFAMQAGVMGFGMAIMAHTLSDQRSSALGLGMTKGGERARRAQAIAYAIPVAAMLTVNTLYIRDED